jgi:hypothetical protein
MIDPKTTTLREGRIEISPERSGKVIISFPPYLGTRHEDLLPAGSTVSRFRRRPSYAFKKSELGVTNQAPEHKALNVYQLRELIALHGTRIIIMAAWVYPQAPQGPVVTWLKLEWPVIRPSLKKWKSRSAWNGATRGKDGSVISFWEACAQLQPSTPLIERQRRNIQGTRENVTQPNREGEV